MSLANDSFFISLSNIVGIIVSLFRSPILVRAYKFVPEVFGRFQYLTSIINVISSYASLSMGVAYVSERKSHSEEDRHNFSLWLMLVSTSLTCFSLFICMIVLKSPILFIQGIIFVLPQLFYNPLSIISRDEKRFILRSGMSMIELFASTTIVLILGFFVRNEIALIVSGSIGTTLSAVFLAKKLKWSFTGNNFNKSYLKIFVKSNSNIVIFQTASSLLNNVSLNIPVFFIRSLFGERILGFYALAYRLLIMAIQVWSSALSDMFLPYFSKSEEDEKKLFNNCLLFASIFFFPFFGISTLSDYYINILYGNKFVEVSSIIKILTPWLFSVAVISPYTSAFLVHQKAGMGLIISILLIGARVGTLFVGSFWDYKMSLILFSFISVVFFDIMLVLSFRYAHVYFLHTLLAMIVYEISLFALVLSNLLYWLGYVAIIFACVILYKRREILRALTLSLVNTLRTRIKK